LLAVAATEPVVGRAAAVAGRVLSPPNDVPSAAATIATAAFNTTPVPTAAPPPTVTPPPPPKNCVSELGSGTAARERTDDALSRSDFRARKISVSTADTDTAIVSAISA
jgi:hypothetical protein